MADAGLHAHELKSIDGGSTGLRAFVRRRRDKEAALAAWNVSGIQAEWLPKMREMTMKELLDEASQLRTFYKYRINHQIRILEAQLQSALGCIATEAEADASHHNALELIQQRCELQLSTIKSIKQSSIEQLGRHVLEDDTLAAEACATASRILDEGRASLAREHADALRTAERKFAAHDREVRDAWDERCGVTRLLGEEKAGLLRTTLETAASEFEAATQARRQQHDELAAEDGEDSKVIEERTERLAHMVKDIAHWQQKLTLEAAKSTTQAAEARREKSNAVETYSRKQKDVREVRKRHEALLKAVLTASNGPLAEMENFVQSAERTVQAMHLYVGGLP